MKILTVVGARPQFVKAAVISRAIRAWNTDSNRRQIFEELIHTGQHYDSNLSQVFFDEMSMPVPVVNLQIGSGDQGAMTGQMLEKLEREMKTRRPDCVLVYGDTNSTLAAALAAVKLHIPVAHIEAGERCYNRAVPEEINRVLTDHVSKWLFCCTKNGVGQLTKEGITQNVYAVGDVMYDAFLEFLPKAAWPTQFSRPKGPYILATIHRAENTDDPAKLASLLDAFATLSQIVYLPLHPRTKKVLTESRLTLPANVMGVDPLPYSGMLAALNECDFVMTDSGGLQKEAYFAQKRVIVLREETEWTELTDAGVAQIAGTRAKKILAAVELLRSQLSNRSFPLNLYGDGQAGRKILDILEKNVHHANV